MEHNDKVKLSKYRLSKAEEDLNNARILFESNGFKGSINRSYYSIFHSIRAVLALDGFDSKKHSGIISEFRKNYIKTNIFSKEMSDIVSIAFVTRNESDYDDFFIISKSDTKVQLENAEIFLNAISEYLKCRWKDE